MSATVGPSAAIEVELSDCQLADGKGLNCPGYTIDVYEVTREDDRLLGRRIMTDDPNG